MRTGRGLHAGLPSTRTHYSHSRKSSLTFSTTTPTPRSSSLPQSPQCRLSMMEQEASTLISLNTHIRMQISSLHQSISSLHADKYSRLDELDRVSMDRIESDRLLAESIQMMEDIREEHIRCQGRLMDMHREITKLHAQREYLMMENSKEKN